MFVESVKLINFRCYDCREYNFINGINMIIGNNAVGKTSLVEAIALLGTCKSFRTNNDKELIKTNSEYYFSSFNVNNNDLKDIITIASDGKRKKITINNKPYKSLSEYIGYMKVVVFSPDDLKIIKGEPKNRRRFLDLNLSMINREYMYSLMVYNKVLRERNELLKDNKQLDRSLLNVYTNQLVVESKKIIFIREKFISLLNPYFNDYVNRISGNKECGKIVYKPNVYNNIEKAYNDNIETDIISKTTNVGPHRDDFEIILNNNRAVAFGSQGQIRTLALSLKLSIVKLLDSENNNTLVVLDDVFGELDLTRQNDVVKLLDNKIQIFITSTSIDKIDNKIIEKSNMIHIR